MKNLSLLLLLPFSVLADYLTPAEIDQLVDSAFYSDSGDQNSPQKPLSNYRWHMEENIFIGFDKADKVETKVEWLDKIEIVTNEITQLTGLKFNLLFDINDWDGVREKMENGSQSTIVHFLKGSSPYVRGSNARFTAGGQSVRIYINAEKPEIQISHVIREELANVIGLYGDTWRESQSIFWQGNDERANAQEFSETDRRIIYAYYALDNNASTPIHQYDIQTFRDKISKVKIDDEKVYQGLFADKLPFRPGWLYYNHYPWVYCGRSNSWYYLCANQDGSFLWSERSKQWSLMGDVFKLN